MRRPSLPLGALLGALTSLPLMALLFLAERAADMPFVPFDLFDWLARTLPGGLATVAIDAMVMAIRALNLGETSAVAKLIQQLLALGGMVVVGAVLGGAIAWMLRAGGRSGPEVGAVAGFVVFLLAAAMEFDLGWPNNPLLALPWIAVTLVGWGALLGRWIEATAPAGAPRHVPDEYDGGRRALLAKIVGSSLALALGAWGLGRLMGGSSIASGPSLPMAGAGQSGPLPPAPTLPPGQRIEPAPGTRPELTPAGKFYQVDINALPPYVEVSTWVLDVDGLFDRPRNLSLADLTSYPAVTQPITLSCISNPVGGDLIGTGNWTGVRLSDLLRDLGLRAEARALQITASDGFFESVELADMMDPRTLLVYGMNGEALSREHGFPLRIYIPNRYGMKQPKWIRRVEAIDGEGNGYWVVRGWSKEAYPQIVSVIDTVSKDSMVNRRIPLGGIAWAGDRGILKVEVQVDGGPWEVATLRTPALSPLTWVQWRYDWPAVSGRHTFRVRATDGTGALQIEQDAPPHPNGATGYHSVTATI